MGIQEDIEQIKNIIIKEKTEENVKKKKFKFPFGKKVGKSQKQKGYVTVLVLNENGTYTFEKYKIEDQTILHETIPRLASAGHVMFDKKGNPLLILPSWSVEPFSPLEHYQQSLVQGNNTAGYRLLMARMQNEQISNKPKIGGLIKWIFVLGIAGIVIYAFLSGGGA